VGSRNPPRRLRKEPSMRSVVGISGLQAGEDVNAFRIPEYRLETQGQSIVLINWLINWRHSPGAPTGSLEQGC
ncbi:hypothetical protein, partial [Thermostichus sp. MS-CIW-41]